MSHIPLVSVGVPLYNEAEFLRASLENLLAQTYPSVEILLADNGSADETQNICREFAAKHPQIRLILREKNIGQNANFNDLPRSAKGEFFLWAAGHDLLDPHFIEESVRALHASPGAVLAMPRTIEILPDETPFIERARTFNHAGLSAAGRFRETMWRVDCNYVYGVMCRETMLQTELFQKVPAPDRVFLAELAALGPFVPVPVVRYCRMNRAVKQTELEKRRRLQAYIDPTVHRTDAELMKNEFYRPTIRAFHHAVTHGPFSLIEKIRLHISVWLAGIVKFHLFPCADTLSSIVRAILPAFALQRIMKKMQ